MLGYTLVDGFAATDGAQALARLAHAASAVGGTIVDFGYYGREGVRLSVELAAGALPRLRDALEAGDVHLFEETRRAMGTDVGTPTRPVLALVHLVLLPT